MNVAADSAREMPGTIMGRNCSVLHFSPRQRILRLLLADNPVQLEHQADVEWPRAIMEKIRTMQVATANHSSENESQWTQQVQRACRIIGSALLPSKGFSRAAPFG